LEADERPGGGISPPGDPKVGETLLHVASDDIEAELKKV